MSEGVSHFQISQIDLFTHGHVIEFSHCLTAVAYLERGLPKHSHLAHSINESFAS